MGFLIGGIIVFILIFALIVKLIKRKNLEKKIKSAATDYWDQ
jgi:hypothetical protein